MTMIPRLIDQDDDQADDDQEQETDALSSPCPSLVCLCDDELFRGFLYMFVGLFHIIFNAIKYGALFDNQVGQVLKQVGQLGDGFSDLSQLSIPLRYL
jgi:hypothetical protein